MNCRRELFFRRDWPDFDRDRTIAVQLRTRLRLRAAAAVARINAPRRDMCARNIVNTVRITHTIHGRSYVIEVRPVAGRSLARADRARAGRHDVAHAVLRPDAGRSRRPNSPAGSTAPEGRRRRYSTRRYGDRFIRACSSDSRPSFSAPRSSASAAAPAQTAAQTPAADHAAGRQPAALPRVHLFATGGTISNKSGGRLTVDELIQSIPEPRPARRGDRRAVRERRQRPDHDGNVAGPGPPHQRQAQEGPGPGRRRRHERHGHARGTRLLPAPDGPRRTARAWSSARCAIRARWVTRAPPTSRTRSSWPPTRRRAAWAGWSC